MRVLYVQPAENFGGAERQGVLHILHLRKRGIEVVPVVGPNPLICQELEQVGVTDYIFLDEWVQEITDPLNAGQKALWYLHMLRVWAKMQDQLARIIEQQHVDLVFANRSYGWIVVSRVARRHGIPLVWRGGSRADGLGHIALMRFLTAFYQPDAFIANCEAVRLQLGPIMRSPSYLVPNGVDTTRFDPARVAPRFRQQLGLSEERPVFGLSARPAPEKNLELLAEALALTVREVPDAHLLVAGEYGWRSRYEALYAKMGLKSHVTFVGHVVDVETVYRSCDLTVLTSHDKSVEGSPNVVLESMAMARPVVATRVAGVPELVEHGVHGYLAPPDDAPALARYIVELLTRRERCREMGEAGRALILEKYSIDAVMQGLVRILNVVSNGRRGAPAAPEQAS